MNTLHNSCTIIKITTAASANGKRMMTENEKRKLKKMIEELRPWQQKREIGVPIAFWSRDQAPLLLLMLAGKNRAPRSLACFFGKADYLFAASRVIGQTFSCQRSRANVMTCACARSSG